MKFPIKDFLSKCNQIRTLLQIRSHLPNKSQENFIFCEVPSESTLPLLLDPSSATLLTSTAVSALYFLSQQLAPLPIVELLVFVLANTNTI